MDLNCSGIWAKAHRLLLILFPLMNQGAIQSGAIQSGGKSIRRAIRIESEFETKPIGFCGFSIRLDVSGAMQSWGKLN
jgi:hypothetical protein